MLTGYFGVTTEAAPFFIVLFVAGNFLGPS
jgi:hypothetical protein